MGNAIGLMRWLCGEFVDDPEAPEGIELYGWIPVPRTFGDHNADGAVEVALPRAMVFNAPAGDEGTVLVETVIELNTVRVHRMHGIRVGTDEYWIGWDDFHRLVVAWIL